MIDVWLSSNVCIENPGPELAHKLVDKYTLPNPDYERLVRLGKWTGNTPETLALWERRGKNLILPYGTIDYVLDEIGSENYRLHVTKPLHRNRDFCSKIELYDYQQKAVDAALSAGKGVIVAPCGAGKTQMGLQIAAKLGVRTLWLTHTHDLLNQSMSRAKQMFDLPASAFGTITGGKVEIGEVITFATVQTMAKLDLWSIRFEWECIIVDEAHHVAGSPTKLMQFSKVVGSLDTPHKFGLTATPKRADGLIKCMYAYLGPKVYEISREDVGDKVCPVEYRFVDTGWSCDIDEVINPDGTLDYVGLVNKTCTDNDRTEIILQEVRQLPDSAKILVLTDRVDHAEKMSRMLFRDGVLSDVLTGKTKKEIRDKTIGKLRDSNTHVIIATYPLAKEGLDIPELTHLVLASPNKTDTTIIQAAGRVARACIGKEFGTIIDFNDDFLPLQSWAKKRERIYRKLGYKPQ